MFVLFYSIFSTDILYRSRLLYICFHSITQKIFPIELNFFLPTPVWVVYVCKIKWKTEDRKDSPYPCVIKFHLVVGTLDSHFQCMILTRSFGLPRPVDYWRSQSTRWRGEEQWTRFVWDERSQWERPKDYLCRFVLGSTLGVRSFTITSVRPGF